MNAYRSLLLVICLASVLLGGLLLGLHGGGVASAQVAGDVPGNDAPTAPDAVEQWSLDTYVEFARGALNGVGLRQPGSVMLDWMWWLDGPVNDLSTQSRISPRTSWLISDSGGLSETVWLTVWADERQADHSPDVYVSHSDDDGRTWSPDVLIDDACDPDDAPYPECPSHFTPDVAVRLLDQSVWVVWQQAEAGAIADEGNLYYAVSNDLGASWPVTGTITNLPGKQHWPRIASDGATLYTIWEDERSDSGDIFIARFNPDTDAAWSAPIAVSDDATASEQSTPALAADTAGNLYAVWTDRRNDNDGQVYFSRWLSGSAWADGGWSEAVLLSHPDADWGIEADIRTDADGALFTAWVERVPTGPSTYDFQVVSARSIDQGASWEKTVVHRLTNASAQNAFYQGPSLGVTLAERIVVAWLHSPDSQAATASILAAASYNGGSQWSSPQRVNTIATVDVDSLPSVAMNNEGNAVVAWQDFRLGSSTNIFATGYPADRYVRRGAYLATAAPGGTSRWETLTWTATTPANTTLAVATRVFVDASTGWTEWVTHTVSPATLAHPDGQMLQVQAEFTSAGFNTPELEMIQLRYERNALLYLPFVSRGGEVVGR